MEHILYEGWVDAGEAVKKKDVKKCHVYRVKSTDGSYKLVISDHNPYPGDDEVASEIVSPGGTDPD